MATYAYFLRRKGEKDPLSGRWEIRDLPGRGISGFLEITRSADGVYQGDLFGTERRTLRRRGIIINLRKKHVDWTYYDRQANKTFQVKGILLDDGERMTVDVSSFPSPGKSIKQELLLVE